MNELVLPVNSFLYSLAWNECGFTIELVGDLAKLVLDEHGMLKPFTRYTLWRGDQGRTFEMDADCEIRHELTATCATTRAHWPPTARQHEHGSTCRAASR